MEQPSSGPTLFLELQPCLTMNITLLVPILTPLGGPQALYEGPQNFNESLVASRRRGTTTSTQQVNGNWFSTAQASDDLELLQEDSDMMFFIHKIHVILQTIEFHIHRRNIWEEDADGAMVQGNPGPPPWSTDAGHNMIFLKDVGPHRFAIFCAHSNWHGKKRVVVNALSWTPPVSCDVKQRFKNYCKSQRISPANTISLTGTDRTCVTENR
ncbi:uterocalin-like [Lycaon pictus]